MTYTVKATLANGQRINLTALNNDSAWTMAAEFIDQGAVYVSVAPLNPSASRLNMWPPVQTEPTPFQRHLDKVLQLNPTYGQPVSIGYATEAQTREAIAAYRAQHPGVTDVWEKHAAQIESKVIEVEVEYMMQRFSEDRPTMPNGEDVREVRRRLIRDMYAVIPVEFTREQAYAYISHELMRHD